MEIEVKKIKDLKPNPDNNGNILLYFDYGLYPTERIIKEQNLQK
jgi:hypothetical protein